MPRLVPRFLRLTSYFKSMEGNLVRAQGLMILIPPNRRRYKDLDYLPLSRSTISLLPRPALPPTSIPSASLHLAIYLSPLVAFIL